MWGLYCEYSYIPSETCYHDRCYNNGNKWVHYKEAHTKRSKEQWDFLHSKHYFITKVDPVYSGSVENLGIYVEKRGWNGKHIKSPYNYKKDTWSSRWRWTNGETSKYKRNLEHKKKELSEEEIQKREWKKKFRKDKAKTYYRRGAGKYYKRLSNKMHRSFERKMIHYERYDKLHEVDYKFFLDPWLWD